MSAARGLRPVPRSLRGRLLAGVVVLVTAGLLGSDLATYALLRSYFDSRAERQIARTADRVDQALANGRDPQVIDQTLRLLAGNRMQALLVDDGGRLTGSATAADPARGALVAALDAGIIERLRRRPGRSERLETSSGPFRVAYRPVRRTAPDRGTGAATPPAGFVVAVSLREDDETMHHLAVTTTAVTAVALLALVLLALGVLAVGLRPLRRMAATAGAIAGGDRARRIEPGHPDTEAGRLAVALNDAFDQQVLAEERLRRFVADVSHELRTPLTTIGGWADLYFQGGLADREATTTAMSRIADEAAGMRSLVEELLLLADLDQQRPLAKEPVPLSTLVEEVVADARVIAPDRDVTLSGLHGGPAVVVGDADRLRQLARNLLGNALQHTPPGTPVHVTLGAPAGGHRPQVTLTVADEGPGVPAEARAHLFERFYQGSPVRRRGNGLGLAIARAIVEAHDGTIHLRDPASGTGSEFLVTLPASTDPPPPSGQPSP
jgi:two-component system OmpR family sensor kinase